jgi:hypothetical protein
MAKQSKKKTPRDYMELSIEVMNQSIQEPRDDKVSPKMKSLDLIEDNGNPEKSPNYGYIVKV